MNHIYGISFADSSSPLHFQTSLRGKYGMAKLCSVSVMSAARPEVIYWPAEERKGGEGERGMGEREK